MPFRAIPVRDRLLNRLVKAAPLVRVEKGEFVYRAGDPPSHVVLVRSGHLELRLATPEAGAAGRVVDVVLPWETAGFESILGEPDGYRTSALAGERSEVQRLDGRAVRRVLRTAEKTFDAFWRAAMSRFDRSWTLGPGGAANAETRLWTILVHLATRAGEGRKGEGSGLVLDIHLTHQVLGELAGLHRSTVTTILNEWLYRGTIEAEGRGWLIPDPGSGLTT